jgi:hypothetical protein
MKRREILLMLSEEDCLECTVSTSGASHKLLPVDVVVIDNELYYLRVWDPVVKSYGSTALDMYRNAARTQRKYPVPNPLNSADLMAVYRELHATYGADFQRYMQVVKHNTDANRDWSAKKSKALKIVRGSIGPQVRSKLFKEIEVKNILIK